MSIINPIFENTNFLFMTKRVVVEGKGCPRLSQDKRRAMEQLFNAIILNNSENLTKGLNCVYELLHKYNQTNNKTVIEINNLFSVHDAGVFLIDYNKAKNYNITTESSKTYKNLIDKQIFIDKDFQTDKKIIFDGKNIKFNDSYYEFIERVCFNNSYQGRHNINDEFYEAVVSKFEDLRTDFKTLILNDLYKYINKLKKKHS